MSDQAHQSEPADPSRGQRGPAANRSEEQRAAVAAAAKEIRLRPMQKRGDLDAADRERYEANWAGAAPEPGEQAGGSSFHDLVADFALTRLFFGSERRRMITAGAFVIALGTGIFALSRRGVNDALAPASAPPPATASGIPGADDRALAEPVARAFLAAPTWEEKLRVVREPEATRAMMQDWYGRRGHLPRIEPEPRFRSVIGSEIGGRPFVIFETDGAGGTPSVVAVDLSGSEPKVDWGSHVLYSEMGWEEFKEQRPARPKWFRVEAEASDYFVEPFDDEGAFVSVRLTSPLAVVGLNGFAPREEKVGVLLENALAAEPDEKIRLQLRLRFAPAAVASPAVEIVGMREGWVTP